MMDIDKNKLEQSLNLVREHLLGEIGDGPCWQGCLSSSALATATAVTALAVIDKDKYADIITAGLGWICRNVNEDGGWGDTPVSESNISTTLLCWSAFAMAEDPLLYTDAVKGAESWLEKRAGGLDARQLAAAVYRKYGSDRTFAVPILTMCAICGRLGSDPWNLIEPLAFELAIFPHRLYRWLRLSVVSYALAALIAIGQVHFHHVKPPNLFVRCLRYFARKRTLDKLACIQPDNGGFLEAIPLTSFVVMSLGQAGQGDNVVVEKGLDFITATVREDGSWPIDTNLSTWVTTLSVNALAGGSDFEVVLPVEKRNNLQQWLLGQQFRHWHPYVHTPPGGWAWTDLPGGVPDADDSAGALIALRNLDLVDDKVFTAARNGLLWLLGLQNRDGGMPTFCRGWKDMPFDRSTPDLTAHWVAAISAWIGAVDAKFAKQLGKSMELAIIYLANTQRADGSWVPLWFGNEAAEYKQNPVYGTSRVMSSLLQLPDNLVGAYSPMLVKSAFYLMSMQNEDGGWGGARGVVSTIEETSLAVDSLAGILGRVSVFGDSGFSAAQLEGVVSGGVSWLVERFGQAQSVKPAPIGLYFARLWYYEELYPWIFAASAFQRVSNIIDGNLYSNM